MFLLVLDHDFSMIGSGSENVFCCSTVLVVVEDLLGVGIATTADPAAKALLFDGGSPMAILRGGFLRAGIFHDIGSADVYTRSELHFFASM